MKMLHIIPRKTARSLGMKKYFSGRLCKNNHYSERDLESGSCMKCNILRGRESDAIRRKSESRKEYMSGYLKKYKQENIEAVRESGRKHYAKHREVILDRCERYRENNKDRYRALCHERRVKIKNRIPGWVCAEELKAIRMMHKEARRLESLTGIEFHVDHIIPISGELVSGLHVAGNLQIITKQENLSKNNRFDPWTFQA